MKRGSSRSLWFENHCFNYCFVKIFGTFFLYNLKIKIEGNLLHTISSIQRVNKLWNIRNLSLKLKLVIFETLSVSKKQR